MNDGDKLREIQDGLDELRKDIKGMAKALGWGLSIILVLSIFIVSKVM